MAVKFQTTWKFNEAETRDLYRLCGQALANGEIEAAATAEQIRRGIEEMCEERGVRLDP